MWVFCLLFGVFWGGLRFLLGFVVVVFYGFFSFVGCCFCLFCLLLLLLFEFFGVFSSSFLFGGGGYFNF